MNADTLRRKARTSLKTTSVALASSDQQYEDHQHTGEPAIVEPKTPRGFSRALRSLSSSSLDSLSAGVPRRSTSSRRLQKTHSSSGTMLERLHLRASSRDSSSNLTAADLDSPGSPIDQPFYTMEVVRNGHLKADVSLLKARSEYLVLTDQCLVKCGSVEAARTIFPQLAPSPDVQPPPRRTSSYGSLSSKSAASEIRFEVPLRSIVAIFNDDEAGGAVPGIDLWWFSQTPRLAYCRTHLLFSLAQERDEWLSAIHKMCRVKLRKSPVGSLTPENLRVRVDHIVAHHESAPFDGAPANVIFPVAKRAVGSGAADEAHNVTDGSSYYLAIGPCMCYLIEVLKADFATPPGDLRIKFNHFGTVTLTKFTASVAAHEHRFTLSFRSPFGRTTRLDLASLHYRRIIEAFSRADRLVKPMWPQQLQQSVFEIKGLPAPLQLTAGCDLGGIGRSLQAHCAAYHVDVPLWTVDWHASYQPEFRLLPLLVDDTASISSSSSSSTVAVPYSSMQLMAVFRALRFNNFFRAISFRDVDLSALAGKRDNSPYGEGVVYSSLNGCKISQDHCGDLLEAPVLSQEIHALAFASESVRSIDLGNCLGLSIRRSAQARRSVDSSGHRRTSSELLSPIMMLARAGLCMCRNLVMSGNPLLLSDVDELANIMTLDHVRFKKIEFASCSLGDAGLNKLWCGLSGQARSLQVINTSDNQGVVWFDTLRNTLSQLRNVTKLMIAGNTRLHPDASLFDEAIYSWALSELDLSGIVLNEATVDVLAGYLETPQSQDLQMLRVDSCGLTGRQMAKLFRAMGRTREMTVHANASRLDEGIDELCQVLAAGYGPWSLFIQMVEFSHESSYVKLWEALTFNTSIECLSLAGSSIPDEASTAACKTVANFFAKNDTVRFLDISGYNAKLDEGRLGKNFSSALSGMRHNSRIEHLRVRSQMLNVNIGDLAEAISANKTLHTLDCEDNGFNLSNFRHLIKHLGDNTTICHFSAFTPAELERSVRKSAYTPGTMAAPPTRRASIVSRFRQERPQSSSDKALVQHLKDEWDAAVEHLRLILERNQRLVDEPAVDMPPTLPPPEHAAPLGAEQILDAGEDAIFSQSFGGLAFRQLEARQAKNPAAIVNTGGEAGSFVGPLPARKPSTAGSVTSISELQALVGRLDLRIRRSSSTASSDVAAISPTSSISPTRTPPGDTTTHKEEGEEEDDSPKSRTLSLRNPDGGSFDYSADGNYTFSNNASDGPLPPVGTVAGDLGIQMKAFRRTWGDSVSRIDEEDDATCAA
ncbi:Leucine rich repeat protein [Geosmithia morbida]|uniref:Leucine rich repeat protein n=1 Tax=Geosmithia morbida TaxID=1094350 RepID=A0A9P4YWG4_9HYPO|nr:Leucine rich repeat protein [Geosmithia morbida]KAF4124125.1 Leucine rich repeat protein [Geosmithia morbida]